jgi:hypothetical protein
MKTTKSTKETRLQVGFFGKIHPLNAIDRGSLALYRERMAVSWTANKTLL